MLKSTAYLGSFFIVVAPSWAVFYLRWAWPSLSMLQCDDGSR